jgi:hypothetical protein
MIPEPLLVIVPTRSRPEAIARIVRAWDDTGAWQSATLSFLVDGDDPRCEEYEAEFEAIKTPTLMSLHVLPHWQPLVPKLNDWASMVAWHSYRNLAFMGDDHIPRSPGWAADMVIALDVMGTGIVYPDDGYQHENLASCWAMTVDIVRALGRMVPAPVEHLYCDNSIMDLGRAIGRLKYLPEVLVEHMHPVAGKAEQDEQYERVNGRRQYATDRRLYKAWRAAPSGLAADADAVNRIKRERTDG